LLTFCQQRDSAHLALRWRKGRLSITSVSNHGSHIVSTTYLFDSFEVQANAGVLLQDGKRVKIQEQPFQILLHLLETPGKLVPREDLRNRLWPEKNFEESDRSLRIAAAKLRSSLGDDSTSPRFIETVPRRGYRFIGDVTQSPTPSVEPEQQPAPDAAPEIVPVTSVRGHLRIAIFGLPLLIVVAVVSLLFYRLHMAASPPLIGGSDTIVVGEFTNATGDPDFDLVLSSALRAKLEESPYLNLIPETKFRRLVKDSDSPSLKDELQTCVSLHAQALIDGEILNQPSGYQILVNAWSCGNKRLLTRQKLHANTKEDVLPTLSAAGKQLRSVLGEPESSLQRFNVPLIQATTGSLAALRAFTQGEKKHLLGADFASVDDYKLAVALDPQFALAYGRLGSVYYNLEEFTLSRDYYQKAFDLRERATERERLYIAADYYMSTGEIELEVKAYELWRTMYPRDPIVADNLANEYLMLGQAEKAVSQAQEAIRLDPGEDPDYTNLAWANLRSGNYSAVNLLCGGPAYMKSDSVGFHQACFQNAFVRGDLRGMQDILHWAKNNPLESEILASAAWAAVHDGHIRQANVLFSEAEQSARSNHLTEYAAEIDMDQADLEADLGYTNQAKDRARKAIKLSLTSPTVGSFAALALARSGDLDEASVEERKVAAQAPVDAILNSAVLASVRAAIQMHTNHSVVAIQDLEAARPFDLCSFMELAPAYYRGLAYLQNNQVDKAAEEFKRTLDHRVSMPESPYIVLSQLELGRAFQLRGDRADAQRAYGEVQKIWKDADPDFPPAHQLRAYQQDLAK
jgi:eukaryotic-like serine/threonine-protein kinase